MKLYIDTTNSEKVVVGLDKRRYETSSRKEKSQKLLPFLDSLLKKRNKTVNDISSIEVETGPGSFTGIRVGVSVVQAIGWVLNVPVNGNLVSEGEGVGIKYSG